MANHQAQANLQKGKAKLKEPKKVQEAGKPEQDTFPNIGKPALRALNNAGYSKLEQLAEVSESELGRLHSMGPKALGILAKALEQRGLTFRG